MKCIVAVLLMVGLCAPTYSQEVGAGVHYSWLALGGGTYSSNLVSATGIGARITYEPAFARSHLRLATMYTSFPRNSDNTPPISAGGIDFAGAVYPAGRLRALLGVGVGFLKFSPDPNEFPLCDPDLGCMSEGAPVFKAETARTIRAFLGASAGLTNHFGVFGEFRIHFREHSSWNGNNHQSELTAGVGYTF